MEEHRRRILGVHNRAIIYKYIIIIMINIIKIINIIYKAINIAFIS